MKLIFNDLEQLNENMKDNYIFGFVTAFIFSLYPRGKKYTDGQIFLFLNHEFRFG